MEGAEANVRSPAPFSVEAEDRATGLDKDSVLLTVSQKGEEDGSTGCQRTAWGVGRPGGTSQWGTPWGTSPWLSGQGRARSYRSLNPQQASSGPDCGG